jgi:adenine-specific DNA-methyltransferase
MKGFVPTPPHLVDVMVDKLFRKRRPSASDVLLDPGCGTGGFIHGVLRWCERNSAEVPGIVGIESNPALLEEAQSTLARVSQVSLRLTDFLQPSGDRYDFIIGNPPYVPITGLSPEERERYKQHYYTARGRFDLYLLFFEQALRLLQSNGRLVFVTPEKFLYVQTADALRRQLASFAVEEIELIDESVFGELVTYPAITTVDGVRGVNETRVTLRGAEAKSLTLNPSGVSWLPQIRGDNVTHFGPTLSDACLRISCGVATGADGVYVVDSAHLPVSLRGYALPTISGRQLTRDRIRTKQSMLMPYTLTGKLLPESELGALGDYLREPTRRERLMRRTCVARKPWYAFHENPPLSDILQPKILCKDIGERPWFVIDEDGDVVPRHSVYYLIPGEPGHIQDLCAYLNSTKASEWLMANCQRAANGFVRLQSHILKCLPVPDEYVLPRIASNPSTEIESAQLVPI